MAKKITLLKIAKTWLWISAPASIVSLLFAGKIQSHHLESSLTLNTDVFGRSYFLLTLNAMGKCLISIFPMALLCLLLSLLIALILSKKPGTQTTPFSLFFHSLIDTCSSLPGFLIALGMSAFSANHSLLGVSAGILTCSIMMIFPSLIRFFESQIYYLKSQPYYASAIALGATTTHLSKRHILPELLSLSLAIFPFIFSRLIFIETTLSFLGVGPVSSVESWGQLLNQSREYLLEAPWMIIISGTPLLLTLWSFHLLTRDESR